MYQQLKQAAAERVHVEDVLVPLMSALQRREERRFFVGATDHDEPRAGLLLRNYIEEKIRLTHVKRADWLYQDWEAHMHAVAEQTERAVSAREAMYSELRTISYDQQ